MMTVRFSPRMFFAASWVVILTSLLSVSFVSATDYLGPVFPVDTIVDTEFDEPLPLPKPRANSLVQRPKSKQVAFDSLDPVGSVIPQGMFYEEDIDAQAARIIRQKQVLNQTSKAASTTPLFDNNVLFMESDEIIHGGMVSESSLGMEHYATGEYFSGSIPLTFGTGLFDNLTLFGETTTFKSGLSDGTGIFGFGEGLNWSIPVTAQGSVTAQYGVRAVQGNLFSPEVRSQVFMTAGVFKRFDVLPVQGGVAVDWLDDRSPLGRVKLRQIRTEVSARTMRNFEYGFMGGFDVFRDRPTTWDIDWLATTHFGANDGGAVILQDYYLLFARKHLDTGGQVELRCGSTSRGDIMISTFGEVAINDRLAVNGGVSMLAPSEGWSDWGNHRENWMISMGVVFYFRGGAIHRQSNLHRPLLEVAGNNSFFPRIIGLYKPDLP